ncbi:pre-RNA processing PIH1/Nop17-domain-containing protein [Schizophyllum amplum]|uniref:Pre-RNA processing PIH1/Nop17-domain-containing protein n=1 Tax=Schizophyllum amplum TaxID=97359 RepID=A0A550CH04_9AGAR|nr:pre-RNA processing PIH1/Nop17-domain-containing protein [Auriculariopsis ampla]
MPVVTITPKAHFVAKTSVVSPPAAEPALLPTATTGTPFPASRKVFVNISYSERIPAPPDGIPLDHPAWHLPLIVSEPRTDKDKAGKDSTVIDAIFNNSIKTRVLTEPDFKLAVIETVFQHLESSAQFRGLILSRQISQPNIASKGKLEPRKVNVPDSAPKASSSKGEIIAPGVSPSSAGAAAPKSILKKPLIEEISSTESASASSSSKEDTPSISLKKLSYTYHRALSEDKLQNIVTIRMPEGLLTRDTLKSTTLEVEPHRIMFALPGCQTLDIVIPMNSGKAPAKDPVAMQLARAVPIDIDSVRAEWRVKDGVVRVLF